MYGAPFLPVSALNSSQDSARRSKSGVIRHCCYSCFSRFRVFLYSENTKTRIPRVRNAPARSLLRGGGVGGVIHRFERVMQQFGAVCALFWPVLDRKRR